jgi:hypothetical protein
MQQKNWMFGLAARKVYMSHSQNIKVIYLQIMLFLAPPGNQVANRENKHQPVASGETGLLDSNLNAD